MIHQATIIQDVSHGRYMNKQPEMTDATREAIVMAFCSAAREKPIERVTVKEIARLAGYNRTTFYRYFADCSMVLEYMEKMVIDDLLEAVKGNVRERNFDDVFFRSFLDMCQSHKEKLAVLLNDRNRSHFIRQIKEIVIQMSDERVPEPSCENKKHVIMDIYYSGVFSALSEWIQNPDVISAEELLELIKKLFSVWYWPELMDICG